MCYVYLLILVFTNYKHIAIPGPLGKHPEQPQELPQRARDSREDHIRIVLLHHGDGAILLQALQSGHDLRMSDT